MGDDHRKTDAGGDAQSPVRLPGIVDLEEVRIEGLPLQGAVVIVRDDPGDTAQDYVALSWFIVPFVEVVRIHRYPLRLLRTGSSASRFSALERSCS